jgi:hypothetical protein
VHNTRTKISHVGQFLVDLSVQEGSLIARERGLQALFDENADYERNVSGLYMNSVEGCLELTLLFGDSI